MEESVTEPADGRVLTLRPAVIVWLLGLSQIVGYGTLYYSFSILADSAAALTGCVADIPRGCMVTLSSVGSEGHAELGELVRSARAVTLERLLTRFSRAVADGEIPVSTDLHALARFVQTVQNGMSILARDGVSCAELEAVADVASDFPLVLVTKGDLFHQEAKVRESGLADAFGRIEIVSEKDAATYARLFREFEVEPHEFLMVGNSLRSDIVPVLALGGWGVHMPYRVTWAHEQEAGGVPEPLRFREVADAAELPAAVRVLAAAARSGFISPNAR